jgi:hypothetical protein
MFNTSTSEQNKDINYRVIIWQMYIQTVLGLKMYIQTVLGLKTVIKVRFTDPFTVCAKYT